MAAGIFIAGAFVFLGAHADAAVVCTEPLEPICIGNEETYQSEALVERCQSDVEKFVAETDEYVACLEGQAEAKREQARTLAADFRERVTKSQN